MIKEYRVYFGPVPATKEQLDGIEEIVVVQEVDHAWEAQIKLPVCIAEDGSWHGENSPEYQRGARIRVEARINETGAWVPLIDGRVVRRDHDMNAEPGASMVTVVVHDDISLLSEDPLPDGLQALDGAALVTQLFNKSPITPPPQIDTIPARSDTGRANNLTGTRLDALREIAARYREFHVYVLPGMVPGTSMGCFKKLPETAGTELPALYLTGEKKNMSRFTLQQNDARASRYEAATLSATDATITTASAGHADSPPAAGEPATAASADAPLRRLHPSAAISAGLQDAVNSAAAESGYTLTAEGEVLPGRYTGILRPYMAVPVRLSNSRYSGDYVIRRVTHTLGRSDYTQSFSVIGRAASPAAGGPSIPGSAAAAAGAAAVSFNIQIDIF